MIRNNAEVKSRGELITVYFYVDKKKGYHCFSLTLDNAIDFFRQVKKACESEHELLKVPIFTTMMDSKGTMEFYKEDLEVIRPLLADELNYRTGKKPRPEDPNKPDWRKVLRGTDSTYEPPPEESEEDKDKRKAGTEPVSDADKKKYARQRKQKKGS